MKNVLALLGFGWLVVAFWALAFQTIGEGMDYKTLAVEQTLANQDSIDPAQLIAAYDLKPW